MSGLTYATTMAPTRAAPITAWRLVLAGAGVFLLLVYSQAWVFPLMGEQADTSQSGLIRALYLPAYAAGFLLLAVAPGAAFLAVLRQPFLIVLLLLVAASYFWSIAPDQTVRRVFAAYCSALGGVVLASRLKWSELAELAACAMAILAVIALLTALLLPSVGIMQSIFPGAWRGVWSEKNALGGNMALAFAIFGAAAMLNPRRALLWWGFAAIALLLTLMSTSKTSLVALVLGLGTLIFVAILRRGPVTRVVMVWLAIVAAGLGLGVALFAADAVFDLLGKDATLTGRTKIWAAAMIQIEAQPWTGYGYGVVWDDLGPWAPLAAMVRDAGFTPQHAHNSWIEQWLGMGILGLAAFALLYAQTAILTVVSLFRDSGAYLAAPFLIVYSLMTITESIAMTYNEFRWVLFVAIAVKLVWPDHEVEARRI
ncbi:MAG: O-antigen ligase family protein [Phenylobacterium sp.]|uniref:O-antigen ligase family protein n=1 Tax=Phenylobacterium sp. TaxID=1871053 RepID=UPI0025E23A64|nr:O-antigen ligase [Phenylobacterium sp.]MCG9916901.1 O-antigen ligase family protein [Phenylobacterium sp.]